MGTSFTNPMQAAAVASYPFEDNLVLFEPNSRKLYVLNSTARAIWENLAGGADIPVIAKRLAAKFAIPACQAYRDVEICLEKWEREGLFPQQEQAELLQPQPYPFDAHPYDINRLMSEVDFPLSQTYTLAGISLEVRFSDQELQQMIAPIFQHLRSINVAAPELKAHFWRKDGSIMAEINGRTLPRQTPFHALIDWVIAEFVDMSYRLRDCLAVFHAGAVGIAGQAIILAGNSGCGKSTLIATMQHWGYTYLSDDVCPIEQKAGELVPVPMSQNIKEGSRSALATYYPKLFSKPTISRKGTATWYLSPHATNPACWDRTWPVGTILFPRFISDATPSLTPIPPLTALSYLLDTGSLCGESVPTILNWIANKCCYTLIYPSLEATRDLFLRRAVSGKPVDTRMQ